VLKRAVDLEDDVGQFVTVVMLYKKFYAFTRRHFLVRNQRFGTTCVFHLQGLEVSVKMGHTSSPETLVSDHKYAKFKTQKLLYNKNTLVHHLLDQVNAFEIGLNLWETQLEKGDFTHFSNITPM
jgi:hypothetical protein